MVSPQETLGHCPSLPPPCLLYYVREAGCKWWKVFDSMVYRCEIWGYRAGGNRDAFHSTRI